MLSYSEYVKYISMTSIISDLCFEPDIVLDEHID